MPCSATICRTLRFALIGFGMVALADPASATTLRVGKSTLTAFTYTLLEVGMETGIFKKHGLEIESSAFGGGPRLTQAMAAGAIDIGLDGGTDMALIVKGAPMKAIAPISGPPYEMVITVRADSPIKTVADLKGKKIAVTGAGTLTGWITRELVRSEGWKLDDVTFVTSTNVAASHALLKTGEIDALTTDLASTLENERLHRERLLYTFGDLVKDFHMQILLATDTVMTTKPDAVRAFMAAWLETIAFAKANKDRTLAIIHQVLGFDSGVLNRTYDLLINHYSTDGRFSPKALAVLARSYVELKLLDHEPDMNKLVTDKFLPKN
jgi:ABC-type nitrate/sulfonate/bicarbonate transport system substrate-binding protein